jgi:3-phenylpropionate/trans-cinnamate dioxygenase ferredoxin reductase subunit
MAMAMAAERIAIVGAGPAGLATARAYREHGGRGDVTLLGEESLLPYERPPLTKDFLRGELAAAELPIEQERWFAEHDVRLRLAQRVSAIEPAAGRVSIDGDSLEADAIVLATGAEPLRADLPGIDHPLVMTMRTFADSSRIAAHADEGAPVLVLGTGFIGCEIAASLAMRGASVTLVGQEPLPQVERLGHDAAQRIAIWLEDLDVRLVADAKVRAVQEGRTLELEDGSRLEGGCVVLGMGVRPRVELAERAGLHIGEGAILVDAQMRASGTNENVFAVGDVACAENVSAARRLRVEHWGDALEHGEVAGRVLAGDDARWGSVPGFWSTIGKQTLKYAAWGDGYAQAHLLEHAGGGFTVWYSDEDGVAVGVLTHECDANYEQGRELIRKREPAP